MNCPFCAEEIRDEAFVCRHCGRDFAVVRSLTERIATLERELDQTRAQLTELEARSLHSSPEGVSPSHNSARMLPLALSIGGWLLLYGLPMALILRKPEQPEQPFLIVTLFLSPMAFGAWLGMRSSTPRIRTYLLLGSAVGAAFAVGLTILDLVKGTFRPKELVGDLTALAAVIGFILVPAMLFTSGGLIGRWVRRLRARTPANDLANRLAVHLVKPHTQDRGGSARSAQRLATLIAAIAPLLTFIASIVGAYLTYLAAFARQATGK
jgi:hypothetical protein